MTQSLPKSLSYSIAALCLALGLVIGIWQPWRSSELPLSAIQDDCPYNNINPLRCGEDAPVQTEYSVFKQMLLKELLAEKSKGNLSEAAIYFRDLNNGPTFYFNEQLEFAPMSLLKLPVMVTVYKYVENDPKQLEEKLRTPAGFAQNSQIMEADKTLKPNTEYTIDELVRYMIVYSDNRATDMLTAWLEQKGVNLELIRRALSDLGVSGYEADLSNTKITVKQYASIFRILYNASYLNPEMSERALGVLEMSEFKEGLTAQLPADIKVAHKYGVRAYVEGEQQLHDCGIVYYPDSPYMICVMTRGKNYEKLSNYIQILSKQVFDEVKKRSQ